MAERNAEKLTPNAARLVRELRKVKEEIKSLEAEEANLGRQLLGAVGADLRLPSTGGFTFDGLRMTVPAGKFSGGIVPLLYRKRLLHCLSCQPKAAEVHKAVQAGKLTEAEVSPYRTQGDPYFSLAKKAV